MAEQLLLLHLGDGGAGTALADLTLRFRWPPRRVHETVERLERRGWIERANGSVRLTAKGETALAQTGQLPLRHRAA
jgi:Mn-dependent DtxR family transcriptional regulator